MSCLLLWSTRHGSDPVVQELYGDTRNSNADASVSEMHYTTPHFDKRKAHEMLWLGDKANDVTSNDSLLCKLCQRSTLPVAVSGCLMLFVSLFALDL